MPIRIIFALMLAAGPGLALGQCPTVGDLCAGLATPGVEDFQQKWNAADAVVYGLPYQATGCLSPDAWIGIGSYDGPQAAACSFLVGVSEVWKGPAMNSATIGTRWEYNDPFGGSTVPGHTVYMQEVCALSVSLFVPQVYFLLEVDGGWETYRCLGTGTYGRDWLVAQVGVPLPADSVEWGAIKEMYR
jgi:hypothetical protein